MSTIRHVYTVNDTVFIQPRNLIVTGPHGEVEVVYYLWDDSPRPPRVHGWVLDEKGDRVRPIKADITDPAAREVIENALTEAASPRMRRRLWRVG